MMGVEPGASDLILGWRNGGVGVIEIKIPAGRLTTQQNKFLSWADSCHWRTGVARSVKDVHQILKSWDLIPVHEGIDEPDMRTDDQKKKDAFDFYKKPCK